MALPIISAEARMRERHSAKIGLVGPPGVGKTTQLRHLPPESTLFVDLEAGDLSVKDWPGDTVRPRTWAEFRDLVVFLAGPMPTATAEQAFSEAHYRHVCENFGDPAQLAKYEYYFVDSLTVLSRLCLAWCKTQPQAFSEKTGKADNRGAYGLLGQEMIAALTHLQHVRDKHVIYVAILEEKTDDFNRRYTQLQLEGSKTALELPGVLDEVITLAVLKADDGTPYRAFVTRADNPYGFLAKVEIEKDAKGEDRNILGQVIEPDHKDYAAHMGGASRVAAPASPASYPPPAAAPTARPAVAGKPAWAQ